MKFLLDTNFLITILKFKVDLSELTKFGKPELYTLDLVIKELKNIKRGKDSSYAKLALELVKKLKVKILKSESKHADKELERLAFKNFVICTLDGKLIKKIKPKAKVVYLRQKRYLAMG